MKKTILKGVMLTAIASLAMSGYVSAHHPSQEVVPDDVLELQNVSEIHVEVYDELIEDSDLMASTARGSDAVESPTTAGGDGANSVEVSNQGDVPVSAPGESSATQSKSGR